MTYLTDGIENPGSYLAAQRRDWYAEENLIAYGLSPSSQVSSNEVVPATRKRPGTVATTIYEMGMQDAS